MDLFTHQQGFDASEQIARLQLIRTERVGPVTFRQLIARFGSGKAALDALPDMARQGGRKTPLKIPPKSQVEKELAALKRLGGTAIFHGAPDYPERLANIEDAPPVLFALGHTHLLAKDSIGVVGARNASAAGLKLTRMFAEKLSQQGVVIVSGLARGIDGVAHNASLSGGTVACVAGGVDVVYPREHDRLYDEIVQQGCVISEMPLGTKPQARHFPRRNRLISGLSLGLLVTEAAAKSGSLISARLAAEQGREVFAVPGSPLDPRAQGPNSLIRDGATLVESADDILRDLDSLRRKPLSEPDQLDFASILFEAPKIETRARDTILELLSPVPVHMDEIIRASELDAGEVLAILLSLELAGSIVRYPGGRVARIDNLDG